MVEGYGVNIEAITSLCGLGDTPLRDRRGFRVSDVIREQSNPSFEVEDLLECCIVC